MGTVGIWCIGDVNYLVAVLNALAMLSNSGLFIDLFRVGLILAVLLIAFEALFRGGMAGGVPWARFIVAIIVFKFLFATTCTVQVNDTYSLQSMAVDNVPYGVAITGSIFSTVAHEITLALEQAFSMPTMTDAGFGGPLQALAKGQDFITGLDTLNNGKITKTLEEYADKCTSTGINIRELNLGKIQTAADPWAAMK
jgi:conjugal transfer mating pair stabilization protein TraG